MPSFSSASNSVLNTCDDHLQVLFREVVKRHDCSIIGGRRTYEEQLEYFTSDPPRTRTMKSKHLPPKNNPTAKVKAVDAAPYPIDWDNRERFILFAGIVLGDADMLGINLRWGGDWDGDGNPRNNGDFDDLVHFEMM